MVPQYVYNPDFLILCAHLILEYLEVFAKQISNKLSESHIPAFLLVLGQTCTSIVAN